MAKRNINKYVKVVAAFTILVLSSHISRSDIIITKDGDEYHGTIIEVFPDNILIESDKRLSRSDIIITKGGDEYHGTIMEVSPGNILIETDKRGFCILSLESECIAQIVMEEYKWPVKDIQIWIHPFYVKVPLSIFDELFLIKGGRYFGMVEMETKNAIYFSLFLRRGTGIVEFEKDSVVGLKGSYGFNKLIARFYFWWKYFLYDLKIHWHRFRYRVNPSEIDGVPIYEWLKETEKQEIASVVGGRKVFTRRTLREYLDDYPKEEEDGKSIEPTVAGQYLILGMKKDEVESILGKPEKTPKNKNTEVWVYDGSFELVFYKQQLISYMEKSRKEIISELKSLFGDKIIVENL
jgi:hypothetical protein